MDIKINDYRIVKADFDDVKDRLKELYKYRKSEVSAEIKYGGSPYGDWDIWVVKNKKSEQIIGAGLLIVREFYVEQKKVKAGSARDLIIDESHRSFWPAFKLEKEIMQHFNDCGVDFIFAKPAHDIVKKMFTRLGYRNVGEYKEYTKILRWSDILARKLPSFLKMGILGKSLDGFQSFKQKLLINCNTDGYGVSLEKSLDSRFEKFNKEMAKYYKMLSVHDSKYLNWRYFKDPETNIKIFCLVNNKDEIQGYIIYKLYKHRCKIKHMLVKPEKKIIKIILFKFINHMKNRGATKISLRFMGNSKLAKQLKKFNFIPRNRRPQSILITDGDFLRNHEFVLDKENWLFFEGDV